MKKRLKILERQIKNWSESSKKQSSKISLKSKKLKPFITVSRDYFGLGENLAKELAKELKYSLYDRKMIDMISTSAHIRKMLVESVDENDQTQLDELFYELFNVEYVRESTYLKHLSRIILSLISRGNVIIVGRGANFIAPFNWGLQIRVLTPLEERVKRLATNQKISTGDAQKIIERMDRKQSAFIKSNFGRNINDPFAYDLIINLADIPFPLAKNLVARAFREKLKGQ